MGQEVRARGWDKKITKVIGFDARGFIYGPLVAQEIGAGFVSSNQTTFLVLTPCLGHAQKTRKTSRRENQGELHYRIF